MDQLILRRRIAGVSLGPDRPPDRRGGRRGRNFGRSATSSLPRNSDAAEGTGGYPSPEGLLVQRTDESPVPVWHPSDPAHPDREPTPQLSHAGAANARVELWRVDLDGEGVRVPLPDAEYLATVRGDVVGVFDRAQTTLTLV